MTARKEIIDALQESEDPVVGRSVLRDRVNAEGNEIDAALRGLRQEGVVEERRLLDSRFYSLADGADVEQAAEGTSASEIAQSIIDSSSIFRNAVKEQERRQRETQEIVDRLFK